MGWTRFQISLLSLALLGLVVAGFSPSALSQQRKTEFRSPVMALFDQVDDASQEKVWRYVKRPLLSIGSKGAAPSHGNSLKQLLEDHTAVKVKVNTKPFGTLENAYRSLRDLAVEAGASENIEMIQMRENDRTILFGLPGTIEQMKEGTFPPPPPPPKEEDSEGAAVHI